MASEDPPQDVLSSLPRTRPQRRSARREAAAKPAKPAAPAPAAARKPKPAAAAKSAARARKPAAATGARSPRGTAAKRIPPAGFAPPREQHERPAPSGAELVGTAVQAAGELAQIGLAVGGQALKSALSRVGRG